MSGLLNPLISILFFEFYSLPLLLNKVLKPCISNY